MKCLAVLLVLSASLSSFASEEIFQALRVQEKTVSSESTAIVTEKALPGVSCLKSRKYASGTKFQCEFSFSKFDAEKVFKAMKVTEVQSSRDQSSKKAGNLICSKLDRPSGKDLFDCTLATASVKGRPEPRE